jgi:ketosteroid isomerase-like protein
MGLAALLLGASLSQAQTPAPLDGIKKAIQAGQLDQALKLTSIARESAPKDVQLRFMEAVVLAQQGQTDRAIEIFKKITETHPDQSEAYNNLGVLYASKGRLEEARTYLEKALQTHPSFAAIHRNLSDVHGQLAKQNYAKALQVSPKTQTLSAQLTLLGSIVNERRDPTPPPPAPPVVAALPPPLLMPKPAVVAQAKPVAPAATPLPVPSSASLPPTVPATVVAAAVEPPAAKVPKATAEVESGSAEKTAVKADLQLWAKAWAQKDLDKYFAAYAKDFDPPERLSRAKWEADRRNRIVSKKKIGVELKQIQIQIQGNKATVKFQQIYESDNFKGNSRKTLDMAKQGDRWLILRESVN